MLKMKVKLNFKLLSSNVYDGVIRAEALNTCGLVALLVDSASQHSTPSQKSGMARGNADTQ